MGVTLETGSTFAGKYRIDGTLGRGGMGSVFAATNLAVGRRVAIKVMETDGLDAAQRAGLAHRFTLEARATSVIDHVGIVDVLDMGETDQGAPYMVMEFLEGATLKAVQEVTGPMTVGQALAVLDPVLDALAAAHAAKVIHRDIKPANIFLCTRPRKQVKVLDFGISRFGTGSGLTQTGMAMGTPQYMAPEQVRGEKGGGAEADLYSVGALIYALISGHPPFQDESGMAVLARVLTDEPLPLSAVVPGVPSLLSHLVGQLLIKDRFRRPSSAAELRQQLLSFARPDDEPIWQAAHLAVKMELSRGTPRPATGDSGPPGVLALPGTPPRNATVPAVGIERTAVAATTEHDRLTEPGLDLESVRPSRVPLVLGGLALLAVAAAVGGVLSREGAAPPVVTPPQIPAAVVSVEPPKGLATVELTLRATPAEARFVVDGEARVGNPCVVQGTLNSVHHVKVQAEHFALSEFDLVFDHAQTQNFALAPEVVHAPTAGAKEPPKDAKARPPKGMGLDESNPFAP
jgi:serine/threonine-protein kinase